MVYDGTMNKDKSEITVTFKQAGANMSLILKADVLGRGSLHLTAKLGIENVGVPRGLGGRTAITPAILN